VACAGGFDGEQKTTLGRAEDKYIYIIFKHDPARRKMKAACPTHVTLETKSHSKQRKA